MLFEQLSSDRTKIRIDTAIIARARDVQGSDASLAEIESTYTKIDEILDFDRRRMSVVVTYRNQRDTGYHQGRSGGNAENINIC